MRIDFTSYISEYQPGGTTETGKPQETIDFYEIMLKAMTEAAEANIRRLREKAEKEEAERAADEREDQISKLQEEIASLKSRLGACAGDGGLQAQIDMLTAELFWLQMPAGMQ